MDFGLSNNFGPTAAYLDYICGAGWADDSGLLSVFGFARVCSYPRVFKNRVDMAALSIIAIGLGSIRLVTGELSFNLPPHAFPYVTRIKPTRRE